MLRELFIKVLNEYEAASQSQIANHPLAQFIRKEFRIALDAILNDADRYLVKGSAGQGNWGKVPWVATMDTLITSTAQTDYYLTYLFKSDMSGFYLNINQGVTDIKNRYKSSAKEVLKIKAADFLAQLGPQVGNLQTGEIRLGTDLPPAVELYEYGSVCSIFYSRDAVPTDDVLLNDYRTFLSLYDYLVNNDVSSSENLSSPTETAEYEDTSKRRKHERIERNPRLVSLAKKYHGHTCQICSMNFEQIYGEVGKGYIEAHHLVPLAEIKNQKIALDPKVDFTVLCANCHRMVHRLENPANVEQIKNIFKGSSRHE
jgi:Predicted restriction endonuclease